MIVATINGGGPHVYPSPLGEIHVDQHLDEITLMRLIDAVRDCGLQLGQVTIAEIFTGFVRLTYFDLDERPGCHKFRFDDRGDVVQRVMLARSR